MKSKILKLALWIISFQLISLFLGYITQTNMQPWYDQLNRSSLTPPGYVFGIVWPLLYTALAIVGWYLWSSKSFNAKVKTLFLLQMLANWLWTPVFFYWHLTGVALILIGVIILLSILIAFLSISKTKVISLLLAPYLAWLCFAFYLNFVIWKIN